MYDIVFIVLTYKSYNDIYEFIASIQKLRLNTKVIIVDAFYSTECSEKIKMAAYECNADYIEIENKGYSYGNNRGIEYAVSTYRFKYLVVSNADIILKKFDIEGLKEKGIYGPEIITLKGKHQNPSRVRYSPFGEILNKIGYKRKLYILTYIYIAYNKLERELFRLIYKNREEKRVYALHGSFVIFPYNIIIDLMPVYCEKMFLFGEEDYLAFKLKKKKINSYYTNKVEIIHKEDGSVGISNVNELERTRESYIVYFKEKERM